MEQRPPVSALQLGPEIERPQDQWHIIWMLEIGLANNPRLSVRAAAIVTNCESIDAQDAGTATGQVIECSASDASEAHDNRIVSSHRNHFSELLMPVGFNNEAPFDFNCLQPSDNRPRCDYPGM